MTEHPSDYAPHDILDSSKSHVTLEALQAKARELLKNPAIKTGGAVIVGLLLARLTAGSKLRNEAVNILRNILTTKVLTSIATAPTTAAAPAPPMPTPPPPAPLAATQLSNLSKQILDAVGPQLGELAKKKLAEIFRPKQ